MTGSREEVEDLASGIAGGHRGRGSPKPDSLWRVVTSHAEDGKIWDAYMDDVTKEFYVLCRGEINGDDYRGR